MGLFLMGLEFMVILKILVKATATDLQNFNLLILTPLLLKFILLVFISLRLLVLFRGQ